MNALKSGIDAQSQIITGEDPEALEHLTARYYERFQPQGPEEEALIDDAISSDWLLRRLRKTEAQLWDRSITETAASNRKWGHKAEAYPVAAAFRDQQKVFERLQHRISCVERSLRAALESLARLRKLARVVGQALSPGNLTEISPASPPPTPSNQTRLLEIGFVPEISAVEQTPLVAPAAEGPSRILPPVKPQRPHATPPESPNPPNPDPL